MQKVILILLAIVTSITAIAQHQTNSRATVSLGFPGSMVLIPIDTAITAYYICSNKSKNDLHIIPNDSLNVLISNWKKGVYEPKNLDARTIIGHNIYIKPHSKATPEVIKVSSTVVRFNWIKSFSISKIDNDEEQLVNQQL